MRRLHGFVRSRAVAALTATALASASGLLVAVSVARTSSVDDTGRFGVAVAALVLLTALSKSAVTDPLVADAHRRPRGTRMLGRASVMGLVGAVVLLGAGVATGSAYLVTGAVVAHGLTLRECVRAVLLATGAAWQAVVLETVVCTASVIALVGTLLGAWDGLTAFALWAGGGALIGYTAAAVTRSDVVPSWARTPVTDARSIAFASDTVIGSGVVQLVTWIATAIGGLSIAAALRGAGTLAGPVTVALSASRAVLIPRAVQHLGSGCGLRPFVIDTAVLSGLALPALVLLASAPDRLGSALLGATWRTVEPVLLLTAVELFFQMVAAVPEVAHRAIGNGRRIVSVRIATAAVRLPAVIIAASHGIDAIVAAAAVVTVLGAVAWWWSLATLVAPSSAPRPRPGPGLS
ncbi:hypothetical protein [Curtobacterium sp. MCBA15_004]|uniref:hypothetical protein n=1 Tax=unclassified Curtobacterium TaxID=257496 RepID=UPI001114BE83|nr:hypothetical protein [Curtobacterium sp. MCBA15_004]WIA97337.1 hypothetical protein QOL16_02785 [Curtobacterium sp. MCBA15_004]